MSRRAYAVALAALLVFGCGEKEESSEQTLVGYKVSGAPKAPESPEGKDMLAKMAAVEENARKVVEKVEVPALPISTQYFADSEAFEEAGYHPTALKLALDEAGIVGRSYVKMKSYNGLVEEAEIYDDMGQQLYVITYLWEWDNKDQEAPAAITGSVRKTSDQRMVGVYQYCTNDGQLYVHDLNSFRVHGAFTRKVTITTQEIDVVMMTRKAAERPAWPTCEDLKAWENGPEVEAYQSPYGIHRERYGFDDKGNPVLVEYLDRDGKPSENLRGISKKQMRWEDGKMRGQAYYAKAGLISRFEYEYDAKGNILRRKVLDANGQPTQDFFGVCTYDYDRDSRDRVTRETRRDKDNNIIEAHEFTYGRFNQVEEHLVKNAAGAVLKAFVHSYNNKGARLSLKVFEGDPKDGNLKLDENLVAIYQFTYTDKGKPLDETRHNVNHKLEEGVETYQLTNARDGWAQISYVYDDKGQVSHVRKIRVNESGNPMQEIGLDPNDRPVHRIEWTYDAAGTLVSGLKTLFEEGNATKEQILNDKNEVLSVALLASDSDGNITSRSWFKNDEQTKDVGPQGWHKMEAIFNSDGQPVRERFLDTQETELENHVFSYTNGLIVSELWTKAGQEKAYKSITYTYDENGNLKDRKTEGF